VCVVGKRFVAVRVFGQGFGGGNGCGRRHAALAPWFQAPTDTVAHLPGFVLSAKLSFASPKLCCGQPPGTEKKQSGAQGKGYSQNFVPVTSRTKWPR
jgi:hypothetical protein